MPQAFDGLGFEKLAAEIDWEAGVEAAELVHQAGTIQPRDNTNQFLDLVRLKHRAGSFQLLTTRLAIRLAAERGFQINTSISEPLLTTSVRCTTTFIFGAGGI